MYADIPLSPALQAGFWWLPTVDVEAVFRRRVVLMKTVLALPSTPRRVSTVSCVLSGIGTLFDESEGHASNALKSRSRRRWRNQSAEQDLGELSTRLVLEGGLCGPR